MKLNKELYRFLGKALLAVDSEVFGWLCAEPRAKSRRTLREKHEPKHGRANREMIKIYEEAKYDLDDLLRLHRLVQALGMEKHDIINAFELIKHNQLENLQWKAGYLRSKINMLEWEKRKSRYHLFDLERRINESEETLAHKRGEMAYLNRECRKLRLRFIDYNTHNLHPIAQSEPDTNSLYALLK